MDLDVLMLMSANDNTRANLERIKEQYNSIVPVVNDEYISFCSNVFRDTIDSENMEQLNRHLSDCNVLRRKKQESIGAISKLLERFGSFFKMKENEEEQLKVLETIERKIQDRLGRPDIMMPTQYQPVMYGQSYSPDHSVYAPQDTFPQRGYMPPEPSYENKPIRRSEIDYGTQMYPKMAKRIESERPINEPLVNNAMSKIYKRIKKTDVKCIFDSNVDGWDRAAFTELICGLSNIMIIVFPVDDRAFGCYIDSEVKPHVWNGGEASFLCALHGNDFFWVHGYNKGIQKETELLKIGEPSEDVFFYFTKYISFQANKGMKKSHFDAKILEVVQQKAGTFIGDGITKYFELGKFIVLHFS